MANPSVQTQPAKPNGSQRALIAVLGAGTVAAFFLAGILIMKMIPGDNPPAENKLPTSENPAPQPTAPALAVNPVPPELPAQPLPVQPPAQPFRGPVPAGSTLHGGVGMGTWDTAAQFKDILVQTADKQILLRPDFAKGTLGWQTPTGQWDGVSGILTQSSRMVGCRTYVGDSNWSDYTYSLKAKRTDGTEGFLIIFAEESPGSLFWWNIGGWGNTRTAIEKTTNGAKREIPGTAVDIRVETDKWYDIRIELRGETASCYFDGELITTITGGTGKSTRPDAGPPRVFNNGDGPMPGNAARSGRIEVRPATNPGGTRPAPTNPGGWLPNARG